MDLPLYGGSTDGLRDQFGPERTREVILETERHVYETPFMYPNVEVGSFYENAASFRLGPPYPRRATVRCGCLAPEDLGTSLERYPAIYAIRVVETLVIV
jgi:hypothetical protein